jgi:uncharacterized protein (TIGR00251 family)
VKVYPGAARDEIIGLASGALQLKIAAPPEKGKANRALIDFLSDLLDIKKSAITIVKGETGRNKLIAIQGLTPADVIKLLSSQATHL